MTDSDITMWRNTDPVDGTWTLGRFTGPTDDGDGRHAIWAMNLEQMAHVHALLGDILNLDGHDQEPVDDREEKPTATMAEAPELTEEEMILNNVWQSISAAQRIAALQAARREVRLGILTTEIGKPSDDVLNAHPLVVAIDTEIADIREQMAMLV